MIIKKNRETIPDFLMNMFNWSNRYYVFCEPSEQFLYALKLTELFSGSVKERGKGVVTCLYVGSKYANL